MQVRGYLQRSNPNNQILRHQVLLQQAETFCDINILVAGIAQQRTTIANK